MSSMQHNLDEHENDVRVDDGSVGNDAFVIGRLHGTSSMRHHLVVHKNGGQVVSLRAGMHGDCRPSPLSKTLRSFVCDYLQTDFCV